MLSSGIMRSLSPFTAALLPLAFAVPTKLYAYNTGGGAPAGRKVEVENFSHAATA